MSITSISLAMSLKPAAAWSLSSCRGSLIASVFAPNIYAHLPSSGSPQRLTHAHLSPTSSTDTICDLSFSLSLFSLVLLSFHRAGHNHSIRINKSFQKHLITSICCSKLPLFLLLSLHPSWVGCAWSSLSTFDKYEQLSAPLGITESGSLETRVRDKSFEKFQSVDVIQIGPCTWKWSSPCQWCWRIWRSEGGEKKLYVSPT